MIKYFAALLLLLAAADTSAQTKVNLAPYLSIRGAGAPSLSPDGEWVVYGSGVSGTSQLWKIPARETSDGRAY